MKVFPAGVGGKVVDVSFHPGEELPGGRGGLHFRVFHTVLRPVGFGREASHPENRFFNSMGYVFTIYYPTDRPFPS